MRSVTLKHYFELFGEKTCFLHIDCTIPLLLNPKFQASSHCLWLYSRLCWTWSETQKTGFVVTLLICGNANNMACSIRAYYSDAEIWGKKIIRENFSDFIINLILSLREITTLEREAIEYCFLLPNYDFPLFAGEELYKCGHLIVEHLQ